MKLDITLDGLESFDDGEPTEFLSSYDVEILQWSQLNRRKKWLEFEKFRDASLIGKNLEIANAFDGEYDNCFYTWPTTEPRPNSITYKGLVTCPPMPRPVWNRSSLETISDPNTSADIAAEVNEGIRIWEEEVDARIKEQLARLKVSTAELGKAVRQKEIAYYKYCSQIFGCLTIIFAVSWFIAATYSAWMISFAFALLAFGGIVCKNWSKVKLRELND